MTDLAQELEVIAELLVGLARRVREDQVAAEAVSNGRLLDVREAAELLGLRVDRTYELARQKKLPSVKIGERSVRFPERAIRLWLERRVDGEP